MIKKTGIGLLFLFVLTVQFLFAQERIQQHPQNYFKNPLEIPITLSGGFAECRPNHFHTGLDMKTNQKENLRVLTAAEGYISRISISHSGYGNCLYVTHPNGYTTVYGHLNDFFPELQKYVVEQQYLKELWNLDFSLTPEQFPVSQGQLIAYSGTTGGSMGPHLHFEIRDTKTEHVLNGFLFGLPIKDSRAPEAKRLAIYDGSKSIYNQDPLILPTIQNGNQFHISTNVLTSKSPIVFLGIQAQDYMNNSTNWLGIYKMSLYLDDKIQFSTRMDELDFAQNRYMNAYADFKTKEKTGTWFQGLYKLPNNQLNVYDFNLNNGFIDISEGLTHEIRIELEDPFKNKSEVRFAIKYNGAMPTQDTCKDVILKAKEGGSIETKTLQFYAGEKAFYDDICLEYTEKESPQYWSNTFQLSTTEIPIHTACGLNIKLNKPVPFELRSKLIFVHHVKSASLPGNNPQDGMAVSYKNSWASAQIKTFGNYYVDIDTVAPKITPLQKDSDITTRKMIQFKVEDDKTSVTEFKAELNGQWLRFVRSGNRYSYVFDDYCPVGKNTLIVSAEDENENRRTFTLNFVR